MGWEIEIIHSSGHGFYKFTTVSTAVSTTTPTVITRFLHTLLTLRLSQVVHWVSTALSLLIVQSLIREFLSTLQEL